MIGVTKRIASEIVDFLIVKYTPREERQNIIGKSVRVDLNAKLKV